MQNQKVLDTLFFKADSYKDFIKNDDESAFQKQMLIHIGTLQCNYSRKGYKNVENSSPNYNIVSHSTIDWDFEVYKMKKCILNKKRYNINYKVVPLLTKHANQILLLAMAMDHEQIVRYFMSHRLINVNDSLVGTAHWPSYFLLACSCTDRIFNIFMEEYISYSISWGGLTPTLLCCFTNKRLPKSFDLDYLTYQEYSLLNQLRGIHIKNANRNYPLFLLDFVCMLKNTNHLREILERVPEAGSMSRLNFLVQNKEHLILIMTRYGFNELQEFNGLTPLHISCLNNDLFTLAFLMYAGFPVLADIQGRFPDQLSVSKILPRVKAIFKLSTGLPFYDCAIKKDRRLFYKEIFVRSNKKLHQILNINDVRNVCLWEVFKYLDFNEANRIYKKSRFNIVSIFTNTRAPLTVETEINRLIDHFEPLVVTTNINALIRKYHANFKRNPC